jgi:hypothetical protein
MKRRMKSDLQQMVQCVYVAEATLVKQADLQSRGSMNNLIQGLLEK